jgi:hypothetical protein
MSAWASSGAPKVKKPTSAKASARAVLEVFMMSVLENV